jgi:diguanylate cyclase (GGDEF)-like protein
MDILITFDSRTTALLVVIAFFIQAFAIGAQAFLIREYKGVGIALLGNLSLAVGFALLLFRGILPDFLTIVVANTLSVMSGGLYYIAMNRFTGQRHNLSFIISLITLNVLTLIYFTYVDDNVGRRIIIVSTSAAIFMFFVVGQFWKARRAPYRFSMVLAVIPFTVYGLFLGVRAIVTIFSPPTQLFSNTPVESATYLLLFIISFLWTIGFILMVSQRLQIDLTELATVDTLTRIPNRHATQIFFEKELARSQRHKTDFTILLIDLDNFKQVNDKYGHAMGDYVLITAAQFFLSTLRKQDIVGRWGGEEFLIILPDTNVENTRILAERIRKGISEKEFKFSNISTRETISIGIAPSNQLDSIDVILKKADDALYVAKATKDAVVVAG